MTQNSNAPFKEDVSSVSSDYYVATINCIGLLATQQLDQAAMLISASKAICEQFVFQNCWIYVVQQPNESLITYQTKTKGIYPRKFIKSAIQANRKQIDKTGLILPIVHDKKCLGALVIQFGTKAAELPAMLPALELLALHLGTAITNGRLFENIQKQNLALRRIANENRKLYQHQSVLLRRLENSQSQRIHNEKLAAIGRLATSLAHEINNPLQAVHSCLQLMLNFDLDKKDFDEYLQLANKEVKHLNNIVCRILDFAQISAGELESVNLNEIVHQVAQLTQKYMHHHNWDIQHSLTADLPTIQAVPNQMAQAFLAIILKSVDGIDEMTQFSLRIKTVVDKQWLRVLFQGSSHCLTPEEAANISEPSFSPNSNHSMLGLAISYQIVKHHGGTISVNSPVGQGTEFIVSLPR